jgi:hypothetical protein
MTRSIQLNLGLLTAATADYETAWRASIDADAPARRTAAQGMKEAATVQRIARDALIDALADEIGGSNARPLVYAIEATLVVAAARPEGTRPSGYREEHTSTGGSADSVMRFIKETVREEGIV